MDKIGLLLKSIIDQDECYVIVCDAKNNIVYMNPVAYNHYKNKNVELLGKSILDCHSEESRTAILKVTEWFKKDKKNNKVHTFYNEKQNKDVYMIALRDENGEYIGYYEKHEFRNRDESAFYEI